MSFVESLGCAPRRIRAGGIDLTIPCRLPPVRYPAHLSLEPHSIRSRNHDPFSRRSGGSSPQGPYANEIETLVGETWRRVPVIPQIESVNRSLNRCFD